MSKECGSSSCKRCEEIVHSSGNEGWEKGERVETAILISFAQVASKLEFKLKHHDLVSLLNLSASTARSEAHRD